MTLFGGNGAKNGLPREMDISGDDVCYYCDLLDVDQ